MTITTQLNSLADLPRHIGQEVGVSNWLTLDQARIKQFAEATGDHQWIHLDEARAAKESPFGGTIAHGYLTLALLAPTQFELVIDRLGVAQAVNYGLDRVRFMAPVRAGQRVRNRIKIVAVGAKGKGTLLTLENTIEIDGGDKPALIALSLALLMS